MCLSCDILIDKSLSFNLLNYIPSWTNHELYTKELPMLVNCSPSSSLNSKTTKLTLTLIYSSLSMGLVGLRTTDNMMFYEDKKPLVVAYFVVDYVRNPKGTVSHCNECYYY